MPLTTTTDYEIFDGTETVTFVVITNGASASTVSVDGALRRALSKALFGGELNLLPGDLVWHLPNTNMGAAVPKVGDTITDSTSVIWAVLAVSKDTLGTRWRCITRQQRT